MIFGNISNLESYLSDEIIAAIDYYKANDLLAYEPGSHPINGDKLFVNIAEYETTSPENRFWEAHKDYLDLHIILKGRERIDLNFLENMKPGAYVKEDDFLPIEGESKTSLILEEGDFLICYPDDGHMTGLKACGPEKIKKAIFKIKI